MSIKEPGSKISVSGVSYQHADANYFDKRSLKRSAGVFGLWGIGVAAVISGDFSGWNAGIGTAGWGGFLLATIVVVIMYSFMMSSIAEMSAAMPHTGGAYSFARAAMGPWGGFVTGLAESIEYVVTTATVVLFSAQYADGIVKALFDMGGDSAWGFGLGNDGMWIWWLALYVVFLALNMAGAESSFKFAAFIAVLSVAIVVLFGVLAIASGHVNFGSLFDIKPTAGNSTFLPFGVAGVFFALPFAMWLFLGIEELPLAAEEAHNPERDIPRASKSGMITLVITGAIVVFLNPAVLGSKATGASGEPLLDGFRAIFPGNVAAILSAFALVGLLASVQGIMYAYGRNLYSLSRAGYYPKFLSLTGKRKTPWVALVVGGVIGFVLLFVAQFGGDVASSIVLNIAVWGAVLAYLMQMLSFVVLRFKYRDLKRPYVSKVGIPGAIVAGVIALAAFIGILLSPSYTLAIVAIAIVYVIGLVVFGVWGRKRLILAPEEEYALSGGAHGNPEVDGYTPDEQLVEDLEQR